MRKCKECGKLFQPKGREQYCSDTHYRPCPSCGKPVIAKYLSDPPRRCDNCKKSKVKPSPLFSLKPREDNSTAETRSSKIEDGHSPILCSTASTANSLEPKTKLKKVHHLHLTDDIRQYIGKWTTGGLIPGHNYSLAIERDMYGYVIQTICDVTEDRAICVNASYSSTTSINQNWRVANIEE